MKKLIYILFLFITIGCGKDEHIRECCCYNKELVFSIEIKAEKTQSFLTSENLFDEENTRLYKQIDKTQKEIKFTGGKNNDIIILTIYDYDTEDIFTGNLETIYLQNKTSIDTIKIKGRIVKVKCGEYAQMEEVFVNGQKTETENRRIVIK